MSARAGSACFVRYFLLGTGLKLLQVWGIIYFNITWLCLYNPLTGHIVERVREQPILILVFDLGCLRFESVIKSALLRLMSARSCVRR